VTADRLAEIQAEHERHFPEESVKVYLDFDVENSRWIVAGSSVDGHPLDAANDGGSYCDFPDCQGRSDLQPHRRVEHDRPEWVEQHLAANETDLPTGRQLYDLLGEAIGMPPAATGDQLRTAAALIAEYDGWSSDRADLSANDGPETDPDSGADSDDAGCDLASRAVELLRELTGMTEAGA
jgi:hypothetical protein